MTGKDLSYTVEQDISNAQGLKLRKMILKAMKEVKVVEVDLDIQKDHLQKLLDMNSNDISIQDLDVYPER